MPTMQGMTDEASSRLRHLIEANDKIDWRTFSFGDPSQLQALRWQEHEGEREALLPLLKAYQRLLHILPVGKEHCSLPLLRIGIHSAIQIASMPKAEFIRQWTSLFPDEAALGEAVYQNAISRRSYLLLQHIQSVQSSEPHYRAARFR
jgi:hypothetical protein